MSKPEKLIAYHRVNSNKQQEPGGPMPAIEKMLGDFRDHCIKYGRENKFPKDKGYSVLETLERRILIRIQEELDDAKRFAK